VLLTAPPDDLATPGGSARVLERHACAYRARRFGHVVLQYQGHVVSLLVAAHERPEGARDLVPRPLGAPVDGLSVVSVNASRHAVLLVSDMGSAELTRLSEAVSRPLAQRLAAGASLGSATMASSYVLLPLEDRRPMRPARLE
jgi:hypothetical protein